MFDVVALMEFIQQVSGTPYIRGGDSPAGTDCSGLASWVTNVATGRPAFGDRFHTSNEEHALLVRGFQHGTAPDALVVGWNGSHTAVTLPDGTPVSSGEGGGVRIGGGGAYQPQFTHHMFLPINAEGFDNPPPFGPPPPFGEPAPEPGPPPAELVAAPLPPPPADELPGEPAPPAPNEQWPAPAPV